MRTRSIAAYWAMAGLAGLVATACGVDAPSATDAAAVDGVRSPIVGGTTESGWPAVGALTMVYPGYGYTGSFCTGTLIAPQWVLTAAHCVVPTAELPISADITLFYVGPDANPGTSGWPSSGTLHQADKLVPHPQYNSSNQANDIALVHLAAPVTGVTPIATSTTAMNGGFVGDPAFYVGFGVTDGINQAGSGVKRSATINIAGIGTAMYWSDYAGTGVCFGDSGGPGMLQLAGSWKVVGVNSTVSGGSDPCKGTYNHTRVDMFGTWIANTMGAPLPNCNTTPANCLCAGACQSNGSCNNTVCQTLDCADMIFCMQACPSTDDACVIDCYLTGTDAGKTQYNALAQCAADQCANLTGTAYQTCMDTKCATPSNTCFKADTGTATCEQVYDCLGACAQDDQACTWACYESGTAQSQAQFDAMQKCFADNCTQYENDQTAWSDCVWSQCPVPIETCLPPANCDIAGGDCPTGKACWPTPGGHTDCYSSNEKAAGGPCDPNLTTALDCDDGLVCIDTGASGVCEQMCTLSSDCAATEQCKKPLFTGNADIGVCSCIDADNDTYCNDVDCNDNNKNVHPGAAEACGDSVDNNCNGQVDEGCSTCVDADGDGYCNDTDCNDNDSGVNPGAAEACGDNVDNDCDGQVDEGCGTCTDADGDSYCSDTDCNDADSNVHPGAAEACGDGIDNDCNGQVDEGCGSCTDKDQDGFCENVDCDDNDAAIHPTATEVCGDGVDNDCNGQVDDNCGTAGSGGGGGTGGSGAGENPPAPSGPESGDSGGCTVATAGTTGSAWAWLLMLPAIVLAGRRRRDLSV